MKKVAFISLGCPKNLVDSEVMIGNLIKHANVQMTEELFIADYIIINTCGFIESAKKESIEKVLEASQQKNNQVKLIVTGCLANRYFEELKSEIPEIDMVVKVGDIQTILQEIANRELASIDPLTRTVSTGSAFAYLKIAEGCDNHCTYCAIPAIRGSFVSRRMEDILEEAQKLVKTGIREIVLVAQDTTNYGMDLYHQRKLPELIDKLSDIEGLAWIRLLYAYPESIDENLIRTFVTNPKLLKYIDIPIQHISDGILSRMNRKGTASEIQEVLTKLREKVPGMVVRTTLIVGFPGETEEDFAKLYAFVQKERFERLGVFTFSKEEGTPAYKLKSQIRQNIKTQRMETLMQCQQQISYKKNTERIHQTYETLVEGVSEDGIFYFGRSYMEAPEIDPQIYFTSEVPLKVGSFVPVTILDTQEYDCIGKVDSNYFEQEL